QRMDRNLDELTASRNRLANGGGEGRRRQLVAALSANGCNATSTARAAKAPPRQEERRRETLYDRLTSAQLRAQTAMAADRPWPDGRPRANTGTRGNLRTLCVRTCDGYFFPIAYQTSRRNFDRDAAACASMCPGTNVELYYHHVPGEET